LVVVKLSSILIRLFGVQSAGFELATGGLEVRKRRLPPSTAKCRKGLRYAGFGLLRAELCAADYRPVSSLLLPYCCHYCCHVASLFDREIAQHLQATAKEEPSSVNWQYGSPYPVMVSDLGWMRDIRHRLKSLPHLYVSQHIYGLCQSRTALARAPRWPRCSRLGAHNGSCYTDRERRREVRGRKWPSGPMRSGRSA
jgi:hypothetical protein